MGDVCFRAAAEQFAKMQPTIAPKTATRRDAAIAVRGWTMPAYLPAYLPAGTCVLV